MNFDDKDKGFLPTRNGVARGHSFENRLLSHTDGSSGFNTRVRTQVSASETITTLLRTKNGMPQFDTTVERPEDGEELGRPYLETGQLRWTYPGSGNPLAMLPATWHFSGIDTAADYLGKIKITTSSFGKQAQKDLSEGMNSLAIGYKLTNDSVADRALVEKYGDKVVLKKLACGLTPPSVFSGKMRLFMQAQYGSKLTKFRYGLQAVGTELVLMYYGKSDQSYQMTYYGQDSVGLFTTADSQYYVIRIIKNGGVFQVQANRLVFSDIGKAIRRYLKKRVAAGAAQNELSKIEAYLFTEATIDLANSEFAGEFSTNGAVGETIRYGWKFTKSGNQARVVLIHDRQTDIGRRFVSRELGVTIVRHAGGQWELTPEVNDGVEWVDKWGTWHIFYPEASEVDNTLTLFSVTAGYGNGESGMSFSDAPVYGFYDNDDQWQLVKVSHSGTSTGPEYDISFENLILTPGTTEYSKQEDFFNVMFYAAYEGHITQISGRNLKRTNIVTSTLNVGVASYAGRSYTTRYYEIINNNSFTLGDGDMDDVNGPTWGQSNFFVAQSLPALRNDLPAPPRTPLMTLNTSQQQYVSANGPNTVTLADRRDTTSSRREETGSGKDQFTLIIPPAESSAVIVATRTIIIPTSGSLYSGSSSGGYGQVGWLPQSMTDSGVPEAYQYQPWRWEGPITLGVSLTWTPVNVEKNVAVFGHCLHESGIVGTPSAGVGYTSLFDVSYTYPYVNGTMSLTASYNGRYIGSEGMASDSDVGSGLFSGWI